MPQHPFSKKKKTKRKWTWQSPDGVIKNEINYIICNQRSICRDVSVINKLHTGSDHRLFYLDLQRERNKLIKIPRFPTIEVIEKKKDKYQNELNKRLEVTEELSIDQFAQNITSVQTR